MRINENERKVLAALVGVYDDYSDFCYANFAGLVERTRLDRKTVRRAARSLARKGLAEFGKGLWSVLDDMGEDRQSVCLAAKAQARVAYEPFMEAGDDSDWMTLEQAEQILLECA